MNKPVLPVASLSLRLPKAERSIETYRLASSRTFPAKLQGALNRVAFSAAHVVADPRASVDPWPDAGLGRISGRGCSGCGNRRRSPVSPPQAIVLRRVPRARMIVRFRKPDSLA